MWKIYIILAIDIFTISSIFYNVNRLVSLAIYIFSIQEFDMTELSFAHVLSQFSETKACRMLKAKSQYSTLKLQALKQKVFTYIETIARQKCQEQKKKSNISDIYVYNKDLCLIIFHRSINKCRKFSCAIMCIKFVTHEIFSSWQNFIFSWNFLSRDQYLIL